jgi:plasmid stability protein
MNHENHELAAGEAGGAAGRATAQATVDTPGEASEIKLLSWQDVSQAIDQLIAKSNRSIDLFDHDLGLQGWETRSRHDAIRAAMHHRSVKVRILLRDTTMMRTKYPRLVSLLATHGHRLQIIQAARRPKLEQFFAVADGQHLIFRPVLVQSAGLLFFENPSKTSTWAREFEVLWQQGGEKVFPEAFGL